jgi:hypothetical protein
VRPKPFIVGLLAAMVVAVAVSVYLAATASRVDKTVTAFPSPDGRYKAVRVTLARGGSKPFCFDSISVFLSVYPDSFAESEKAYQVYMAPCAAPAARANLPKLEWLSNSALRITHPADLTDQAKRHLRMLDASKFVHVSFVTRK